MDEERSQSDSHFLPNQSCKRVDNGGFDRISELPNEILFLILSLLPVRRAASTTLLSCRWLDLWKQIPNLKFNLESDRISQLPDQIISLILSFLPLNQAAATCVLSSRWLDSWKHTPNLIFNYDIVPDSIRRAGVGMCKYIEIVNSILQLHKAHSLKRFGICFYINKSAKWAVTKWLEFVFLRKVESLELNFLCGDDTVVFGESLREISTIWGDPRNLIFFQFLKSLHLACLTMSGGDVELFVRNCPFLEQLMFHHINLTSDIEICGPSLKHLVIHGVRDGKSIKVSAPKLTFIKFYISAGKLLFENVPRLVEADFDINTSEFIMHHFASAASSHISHLQFLNIRLPYPKAFWSSAFPQMPNLKKLAITCFEMYNHRLLPVARLIWASPRLEEFTLTFSDCGEAPTPYMQVVSDHVVELVTYISNSCIALRQIDIVGPVVLDDIAPHLLLSQIPNHVQLSIRPR